MLQRLHGLSDREAVAAFEWDARWKFACGGLDYDAPGFVHTVLVSMRARLARSERPRRIFEATLVVAREAKLLSAQRVLDSTPLYDAVADAGHGDIAPVVGPRAAAGGGAPR